MVSSSNKSLSTAQSNMIALIATHVIRVSIGENLTNHLEQAIPLPKDLSL